MTDLLGARIDLMFAPGPVVQQFVQSGQLKALGVTDTKRSRFYPDVPTVAESGVPGYESVGWFGLLAPAGTPPEIVKQINQAIVAAMDTQEFRDHLATLGAEPKPQTPEEFGRYINSDVAKWSKLVKDNDVQSAGRKVMRLATFADEFSGPRFGIVRGEQVIDVVAAANALRQPVPATGVKTALTSGPQTLAALQALADSAERGGLQRPIASVKFLPPIPDPSKFFCVGKKQQEASRRTQSQQDADRGPERADRLHQAGRHHVGRWR